MYKFNQEQLYKLLTEVIDLHDEYVRTHGYAPKNARAQAALDTIEGLDEERALPRGKQFTPSQILDAS